nr:DUF3383 domain-containing protein [Frateuria aurantia]
MSAVIASVGVATADFNSLLIVGASSVISINERLRSYGSLADVASDFGTSAPEYLAAALYFDQSPRPSELYIGRWAKTASAGELSGGVLSSAAQAIANFTAVSAGGMDITIDGTAKSLSAIDLSAVTNLNGVASAVTTALAGVATVTWNSATNQFQVVSATTGATSSVGYASAPSTGTDISALLGLTSGVASAPSDGIAAEEPVDAITALDDASGGWYASMFADTSLTIAQHEAVASYIQGAARLHLYGITTQDSLVLDPTSTTDIAAVFAGLALDRTVLQYSSSSPYAIASLFGRALTVDFNANNTAITLKFKQEPGVTAETLTTTQANALEAKNCNVFVNYANGSAILEQGVMSSGALFDEIQGVDWLQNAIQTAIFNLLYTSTTKIPQTDAGVAQICTTVEDQCEQGVSNGLLAQGVWNTTGFGSLSEGQTLTKGYYVYAATIASQSTADRAARKSPPIQVAAKLAGAIHSVDVSITVNR